ncbi:hypothetical protein C8J56DRAFT_888187 [Mycena floridula]|nr:hypothetical protein C8J56DRAFT_888187 [Mycena floridula]
MSRYLSFTFQASFENRIIQRNVKLNPTRLIPHEENIMILLVCAQIYSSNFFEGNMSQEYRNFFEPGVNDVQISPKACHLSFNETISQDGSSMDTFWVPAIARSVHRTSVHCVKESIMESMKANFENRWPEPQQHYINHITITVIQCQQSRSNVAITCCLDISWPAVLPHWDLRCSCPQNCSVTVGDNKRAHVTVGLVIRGANRTASTTLVFFSTHVQFIRLAGMVRDAGEQTFARFMANPSVRLYRDRIWKRVNGARQQT